MNIDRIMESASVTLPPVIPEPSFLYGGQAKTEVSYYNDPFTAAVSLSDLSLSASADKPESGRPVALQIICNKFQEAELFGLAFF